MSQVKYFYLQNGVNKFWWTQNLPFKLLVYYKHSNDSTISKYQNVYTDPSVQQLAYSLQIGKYNKVIKLLLQSDGCIFPEPALFRPFHLSHSPFLESYKHPRNFVKR